MSINNSLKFELNKLYFYDPNKNLTYFCVFSNIFGSSIILIFKLNNSVFALNNSSI